MDITYDQVRAEIDELRRREAAARQESVARGEGDVPFYGHFDPNAGLSAFRWFYARNAGLPVTTRPRPAPPADLADSASGSASGAFRANGLRGLFGSTEQLPYEGGRPRAPCPPLDDASFRRFAADSFGVEKCGCGMDFTFGRI